MTESEIRANNVAYVNSQVAAALIELEAMKAENERRSIQGFSPMYREGEFLNLIEKYQLGHNAVVSNLHSGV